MTCPKESTLASPPFIPESLYPCRSQRAAVSDARARSSFTLSRTPMAALTTAVSACVVSPVSVGARAGSSRRAAFVGARVVSNGSVRAGSRPTASSLVVRAAKDDERPAGFGRRDIAKGALMALSAPLISQMPVGPAKADELSKFWDIVDLPLEPGVILLDIAFVDETHGFLLGTRQTILETFDGGKTWDFKSVSNALDEDVNYRFNSVSFKGQEGWIVGKPAILLHTTDGGASWERVGLSPRLPGAPVLITATKDNGTAEMVTDEGAIYLTTDAARNWKAAVEETIRYDLSHRTRSAVRECAYSSCEGTVTSSHYHDCLRNTIHYARLTLSALVVSAPL